MLSFKESELFVWWISGSFLSSEPQKPLGCSSLSLSRLIYSSKLVSYLTLWLAESSQLNPSLLIPRLNEGSNSNLCGEFIDFYWFKWPSLATIYSLSPLLLYLWLDDKLLLFKLWLPSDYIDSCCLHPKEVSWAISFLQGAGFNVLVLLRSLIRNLEVSLNGWRFHDYLPSFKLKGGVFNRWGLFAYSYSFR